jgi:urea transporter
MISLRRYHPTAGEPVPQEEGKHEELEGGANADVPPLEDLQGQMKNWFQHYWKEIFYSGNMSETQKYWCGFQSTRTRPLTFLLICLDLVLRGISQVYLCDHPISGLLIAIGVGLSSLTLLSHGIIGVIGSTLGAVIVCRLPYSKISSGLVGYDGALVGCAIYSFCETLDHSSLFLVTFFLSAVSGILHMSLANILGLAKLPPFTAAFNVTAFCLLLSVAQSNTRIASLREPDNSMDPSLGHDDESFLWFITLAIKGVGQFMFADTLLGGCLVILGITLQSRRDGLCAVLGAFVGGITARYILLLPSSHALAISTGLYGYNAAGTCVVLGGGRFYRATPAAYLIGIIGAVLSVYIQIMFQSLFVIITYEPSNSSSTSDPGDVTASELVAVSVHLPVLTFPFITTAWIMMLTQSTWLQVRVGGTEESENIAPSRRQSEAVAAFRRGMETMKRVASFRSPSKKVVVTTPIEC